jgi:CRP-like cAMP-binding protein
VRDALSCIAAEKFDLLLSDLHIPCAVSKKVDSTVPTSQVRSPRAESPEMSNRSLQRPKCCRDIHASASLPDPADQPAPFTGAVQGNSADALFYIQKGKVKLTVLAKNGKEATIGGSGRLLSKEVGICSSSSNEEAAVNYLLSVSLRFPFEKSAGRLSPADVHDARY